MARSFVRGVAYLCSGLLIIAVASLVYLSSDLKLESPNVYEWNYKTALTEGTFLNKRPTPEESQDSLTSILPVRVATSEVAESHIEIFSQSKQNGRYFNVEFGAYQGINPNMIPHPSLSSSWILVAQLQRSDIYNTVWFSELSCVAEFYGDVAKCTQPPLILPIAPTPGGNCEDDLAYLNYNVGPHDARVFRGPENSYVMYGSNSGHTCFGLWLQDLRMLVDVGHGESSLNLARKPVELQRPSPYGTMEKNWFLFWDLDGQVYIHHDVSPQRTFAQMELDGTIGEDLGLIVSEKDSNCIAAYMPQIAPTQESLHQATNSLSITLCNQSDLSCTPSVENTFVMHVYQHKRYYDFHSVYEPYVMLFKQEAPFELYAMSIKPLWIHGRGVAGENRPSHVPADASWDQTEMFYVTSMNWKEQTRKYHGYIDDVILLGFGIEDESSGVIDVLASDLLKGIRHCKDIMPMGE